MFFLDDGAPLTYRSRASGRSAPAASPPSPSPFHRPRRPCVRPRACLSAHRRRGDQDSV